MTSRFQKRLRLSLELQKVVRQILAAQKRQVKPILHKFPKTEKDLWVEMSIREIWTQTHFAEITFSHISPKSVSGNDAVFSSIHSFLSHCAIVSKMLQATDDSNPPKSIGDVLGVADTSLIHQRVFRNHLEHYDERLKQWIRDFGVDANIGTYNIGPKATIQIPNMVFVSHYNPDTETFTFVNDDFNLRAMYVEVSRIGNLADQWVQSMQMGVVIPPFI